MKLMGSVLVLSALVLTSQSLFANSSGSAAPPAPPVVTETSPASLAKNVPTNSSIYLSFSNTLGGSLAPSMLTLTDAAGKSVSSSVAGLNQAAVFTPSVPLAPSSTITATFTDPDDGISRSWTFTTGIGPDKTPPTVQNTVPLTGSANVDPTMPLVITFSKLMNPVSLISSNVQAQDSVGNAVPGNFTFNFDQKTASFTPTNASTSFGYGVGVTINFANMTDMEGNSIAPDNLIFTTAKHGSSSYNSYGSYSFPVPDGVTQLQITTYGGDGGGGSGCGSWTGGDGGSGGQGLATVSVTSGIVVNAYVGQGGGGGSGGGGGGGGGDSYVTIGGQTYADGPGGDGGGGGTDGSSDCGTGGGGNDGSVTISW